MSGKPDLSGTLSRHGGAIGTGSLASLAAVAGFLWVYVEPKAKDLIEEEVNRILVAGDFAKSKDVKTLNRNVEQAEQRIRDLERKQDRNNAKAEAERKSIKEKIDDTNQLIRDVLRMRRSSDGR